MSLRVLEPGLYSLVVDAGRPRTRGLGVPVGGAADRFSFAVGNALVGNPPDAAALEITLAGPTLRAECDLGCVIFGAPFEAWQGNSPIPTGHTFTLRREEILRIAGTPIGMRAYLCVQGGIQSPMILDSRSAFEPIKRDDVLLLSPGHVPGRSLGPDVAPPIADGDVTLRCLPGPQSDWFDLSEFLAQPFTVSPNSNRMGLRLQGNSLTRPTRELTSEPVCPGAVQVVNDGQCIVLGVDGQTIGGYPKIAQVIATDIDSLGQLRPGQVVVFAQVGLPQAEAAWIEASSNLRRLITRLSVG